MKKSLKRAVAVSAVCAAGLAGTLTTTPTATAGESADRAGQQSLTDFGMTALAFGTKLSVGGVDIKSLKDAKTLQACTRTTGLNRWAGSALDPAEIAKLLGAQLPEQLQGLIHLSPSTSTTETYETAEGVTGVRATNLLGDIVIGAEELAPGVQLPTLEIKGLEAVADSFHDPADLDGDGKKFGTAESFDFETLKLILPEDGVIGDTLEMLFENIPGTEGLNEVINVPLGALVDTLNQLADAANPLLGDVIEIPGLGSIGLGTSFAKVGDGFASSGANALQIEVDPSEQNNDSTALLKLGYAQSRIGADATSGVFRSTISGLNLKALPLTEDTELLHLGGIGTQAIPCEGTDGELESKTVERVSFPVSLPGLPTAVATLNGIEYSYKAKQLSRGRATSVATSSLGSLEIPALDLVIEGVESKLKLRDTGKQGKAVRGGNKPLFELGRVLYKGEELVPEGGWDIGKTVSFTLEELNNTNGFVTFGPRATSNFYGGKLAATRLQIGDFLTLDLGWLESQIYPK